jgi:2-C-methyl-D-erythritol 4-phosphate cytidylyltransferase
MKALSTIDGVPHKLAKAHSTKASANEHAKILRKKGKKVKIVNGKDTNGKPVYGVYVKVEPKKKSKKKKT